MIRQIFFLLLVSLSIDSVNAQKYVLEKNEVTFFSDAAIEDISAINNNSLGIIDISSSQFAFSVPIKEFEFEKKLMREHFNEKYMESEKYPKATFQGLIKNLDAKSKTEQQVTAAGKLTIHGVTNEVEITGTLEITPDNKIIIKSTFIIKLVDYQIAIPKLLWQNIAEEVEVKLNFVLKLKP